jgi:HPt (histidine-containing phosphotransfer) domain-containing protein
MTTPSRPVNAHPAPVEPAIDATALDALRDLQEDGEPDILPALVNMFLSDARPRLDALSDAVQRGIAPIVEREAHALKGSCANFGARLMMALCGRLQLAGRAADLTDAPALQDELAAEFERVRDALHAALAGDERGYSDRRG